METKQRKRKKPYTGEKVTVVPGFYKAVGKEQKAGVSESTPATLPRVYTSFSTQTYCHQALLEDSLKYGKQKKATPVCKAIIRRKLFKKKTV